MRTSWTAFFQKLLSMTKPTGLRSELCEARRIAAVQVAEPITWGSVKDPATGHHLCFLVTPLAESGTVDAAWAALEDEMRGAAGKSPAILEWAGDAMVALVKSFADAIW